MGGATGAKRALQTKINFNINLLKGRRPSLPQIIKGPLKFAKKAGCALVPRFMTILQGGNYDVFMNILRVIAEPCRKTAKSLSGPVSRSHLDYCGKATQGNFKA
jgi:hypothetical protein